MQESTRRKGGTAKAQRVSHRRELAVVTIAAVASISGVGGLLAAGQNTPVWPANVSRSALTSSEQPGQAQRPLSVTRASYRGDDGEEAGDDGRVILRPANKVDPGRHNGNLAWSHTSHARPSAVSQGSAPVN
jgi:hypothetical protein